MLTIAPPPCSRIRGAAALVQINGPVRLTCRMRLQSSSEVSSKGANTAMPALLISASSRPKRALTAAMAFATALASETSQCSSSVLSASASAATAPCSNSPSMSSSATRQPSARNRLAVASPMPRAAPVTRAVFCGEAGMGGSIGERRISRFYNPCLVPCPGCGSAQFSRRTAHADLYRARPLLLRRCAVRGYLAFTTLSYAACNRSPTDGPVRRRRFMPR